MIPEEVTAAIVGAGSKAAVDVTGKQGSIKVSVLPYVVVAIQDGQIMVSAKQTMKQARANWGTMAALIKNALQGAKEGFKKNLEFEGVGFRAALEGSNLKLNIGFSHPVIYTPPTGVKVSVEKNVISIFGIDRALVGQVAAEIRKLKKPEPYKGTGIRYQGEVIRRKAGKKAVTTTAT